jgi:hypothetical protein
VERKLPDEDEPTTEAVPELTAENTETASKFAEVFLKFKATDYQTKLLDDKKKRIIVIWPRQSGKSTTLAARMIWYAATHERTLSLIVAPGLRQSMILMDRIQAFLMTMAKPVRRKLISKMQRTVIWFKKGSQIVALPNSPNCVAVDNLVITPSGLKSLESLKNGDLIFTSEGRFKPLSNLGIEDYDGDMYAFETEQGAFKVTGGHLIYACVDGRRGFYAAYEIFDSYERGADVKFDYTLS